MLTAIIKLYLVHVAIYTPGTTANTISFLPLTVSLLSLPPSCNFYCPSCITALDPVRTAGNTEPRMK